MIKSKFLRRLIKFLIAIFLLLVLVVGIAFYFINKKTPYTGNHPQTKDNTVSIILIDGLSQRIFEDALANGDFPNINKLKQKGTYIKNGVGSFPSMTGYAYYPFITGAPATNSGIIGLRWFDRQVDKGNLRNYVGRTNVWMNQDITDSIPTFFELSGDQYTASINSFMNRGIADHNITGWAHTTAKFEGKSIFGPIRAIPLVGEELAKDHFQHEYEVMKLAERQLEKNPKVQWITLPSPDASNHVFGTTETYTLLLRYIDGLVGDFVHTIDSLGQSDNRMIAIVTDHGTSDVRENIDFIRKTNENFGLDLVRGNAVNYRSMLLDQPLEEFMEKDGYFVINGNLAAMLYLKNKDKEGAEAWRNTLTYDELTNFPIGGKTIDIPAKIANMDGMELVIYQSDTCIYVRHKNEIAEIHREGNLYKYATTSGDPLMYTGLGVIDTLMDKEAWIDRTIDSKFPDAVYRITQLMECPIVGDIVMTSSEEYDLAYDYEVIVGNYKGGHGGIRADQLRVPYILYMPGEAAENIPYLRSEEVGEVIKDWLSF